MSKLITGSSPSSSSGSAPVTNNPGIWLPGGTTQLLQTADSASIFGAANTESLMQFVQAYTITVGHVTFSIGVGLAAAKFGVAINSGDGLTKITAADAVDVSAAGVKRVALSSQVTLTQGTTYWLGWVCTDAATVTIQNLLLTNLQQTIQNNAIVRQGRSGTATVGGVTLANIGVVAAAQSRVPLFWFDV